MMCMVLSGASLWNKCACGARVKGEQRARVERDSREDEQGRVGGGGGVERSLIAHS